MPFSKQHYQPSSEVQRATTEQVRNASRRMKWRIKWAEHEIKQWRKQYENLSGH
ncbi:hypothetical protein [Thiolapillus sp.]